MIGATGTTATREAGSFVEDFARFRSGLSGNGRAWITKTRDAAIARFSELGFPTTREERWRFTSVAPIAKTVFRRATDSCSTPAEIESVRHALADVLEPRLVFLNGRFSRELSSLHSLPAGVIVENLDEALAAHREEVEPYLARYAAFEGHPFVALNTAFFGDGAFVHVPRNTVMETPIRLFFVSTGSGEPLVSHPRCLVCADTGSQATLVESYIGIGAVIGTSFTNAVTEIVVGDGAVVDHYRIQRESRGAFHVATQQVQLGRASHYTSHSIAFGGLLVRNELNVVLADEGSDCILDGLYLLGGRQHVDNQTLIDHAKPHCSSRELYKGVLSDQSRGVFNGKILVRPQAQKTDAKQTNKNLLLSNDALVNTMPQLEIYADDVKCTHGATIGRLDEEGLFYLRSRGIGAEEARAILTHAFMSEILGRFKLTPLRIQLEAVINATLPEIACLGAGT